MIAMLVIAAVVVSSPIVAAVVVAVASRREDARWSLGTSPRGPVEAMARRIVAFDSECADWPRSKAQAQAGPGRGQAAPLPQAPFVPGLPLRPAETSGDAQHAGLRL